MPTTPNPDPGPDRVAQCRSLLELYGSDAESRIAFGGVGQVRMRARVIACAKPRSSVRYWIACAKGIEALEDAGAGDRAAVLAARRRLLKLETEARRQFAGAEGSVEAHLADEIRGVLLELDRILLGWEH
jgi:hypothetical protein